MKTYYVYILASKKNGVLYVGITSDLLKRVYEHKNELVEGFTSKYKIKKLVYFEGTNDVNVALNREKQIKAFRREKKIALFEKSNPDWKDLSEGWY